MLDFIENGGNKITHHFLRVKCYKLQPIPGDKSKRNTEGHSIVCSQVFTSCQRNLPWTFAWERALGRLWVWVGVLVVGLQVEQTEMEYEVSPQLDQCTLGLERFEEHSGAARLPCTLYMTNQCMHFRMEMH